VKQTVARYDEGLGRHVNVSGGVRAFLDSICSGLEQPWAFRDAPDADIIETLMSRSGASEKIAAIDAELREKEIQRTEAGRDKKRMGEPVPVEKAERPAPIDGIKAEREKALQCQKVRSQALEEARAAVQKAVAAANSLEELEEAALLAKRAAGAAREKLAAVKNYTRADIDVFDQKLSAWHESDRKAADYDRYLAAKNEWDRLTCLYDDLTLDIEGLRAKRKRTLSDMSLGVKGLEIGEDNMLYHSGVLRGITKSNKTGNWSTSESVQVFFGLGARFAGKMKVLVVDNAESLDAKTTGAITAWAEKSGFLVIMLRVAEAREELEEGVIYIREGEVMAK
jgi:hypothetical protein